MPAKSAQRGTELVIERLQWLAAAGFQPFAVRHVQQQLSGRVQRPDLAGVLYRDMDGDPRCPSVRPRRVHRFRVAVGRNYIDATPTSGTIYVGGGRESLEVEVRLTRK